MKMAAPTKFAAPLIVRARHPTARRPWRGPTDPPRVLLRNKLSFHTAVSTVQGRAPQRPVWLWLRFQAAPASGVLPARVYSRYEFVRLRPPSVSAPASEAFPT